MHDRHTYCDPELVNELFRVWLSTYSDPNVQQKPLDMLPYEVACIREFHKRFKDNEITAAEFGLLVDKVMCW